VGRVLARFARVAQHLPGRWDELPVVSVEIRG
jgi:hypothetical protein